MSFYSDTYSNFQPIKFDSLIYKHASTVYPSAAPEFIPGLVGFVLLDLSFFVQCFVDRCLSFWPLSCLSLDLRILITPLVSSKSSYYCVPNYYPYYSPKKSLIHTKCTDVEDYCFLLLTNQ